MFRIVTDTSSNLPTAYLQAENITVIPFTFHTESGEQSCMDTASFDAKAFYTAMRNGEKVTTSQIPPQRFVDNIRPMLENGEDVLFVSMSSGISGSYASSKIAANQLAEEFPERKILTVDTYSASLAEGIVVMRAVECRKEGLSIDETYQILRALRHRIAQIFTVGDLRYLKRTGRLSNLEAAVGTVLQIKPLLKGDPQGKIVCFAKVRGRQRAIEEMAKRYEELVVSPETQTVCISHADCEADAQILASMLRRSKAPKDILIVDYEPVTGSHVGPGALALFFVSDDNVRNI
jgi:DegV family protein with EDD domain